VVKSCVGSVGILAVRDVVRTSKLLTKLFGWKSVPGAKKFDILINEDGIPSLMLHDFDAHEHDRFKGINRRSIGTRQALYVFVKDIKKGDQMAKT